MAFKLHSRILETFTDTGTGTIDLDGAVDGYKTFASVLSNGDTCFYFMEPQAGGTDYEFGYGTYSGSTLARTTVIKSSNGNALVDWQTGTKLVGIAPLGPSDLDGVNIERLHRASGVKSYKNLLHNGGFQIAQRGDGPFTSATTPANNDDTYLLDGCILLSDGNDIVDVSRVADTDFVSGWCIEADVETANKKFGFLFPIEKAVIQAVRKSGLASVQFKVKRTGSSIANVRAHLLSWNSTADAITSDVVSAWNAAGSNPTFATNWTAENTGSNLAVGTTITNPPHKIDGIAVDTSGVNNLALFIHIDDTDATVGDKLRIGDVQVEEGAHATEYEHRPIAIDLALCERYYEKTYDLGTPPGSATATGVKSGVAVGTTLIVGGFYWRTRKRAASTVTLYGESGTSGVWSAAGGGNTAAASVNTVSETGMLGVNSSGLTDGGVYYGHWVVISEL
jgi:hypothetical protein